MIFNKATEIAISAMSRLAEVHGDEKCALTSAEIAESRELAPASVAKVLTQLAQRGLVAGTQGRKGGYRLARAPERISLFEIASVFERSFRVMLCPFGPGYCGTSEPCPLHDEFVRIQATLQTFLEETTLGGFRTRALSELRERLGAPRAGAKQGARQKKRAAR